MTRRMHRVDDHSHKILQRSRRAANPGLGISDVDESSNGLRGLSNSQNSKKDVKSLRSNGRQDLIESFEVRPMGEILVASWTWRGPQPMKDVKVTNLYYIPQGYKAQMSQDVSKMLQYKIRRVANETQYQVCIRVQKRGPAPDDVVCRSSASQPWHMPASIGSSVGALLALIVVILVMVSLQRKRRHRRLNGSGPSSKRSRIDSALESQFDSIAFREETSFYDDATTIYDSTCAESCLHSSCGANSVVLVGLNTQVSASSADSGDPAPTDSASSPATLDPPPLLGRSVSAVAGQSKSVTFKEERKSAKYGLLQRRESEESREAEPASVVMETVIDTSPAMPANSEDKDAGGLYTQLIETI